MHAVVNKVAYGKVFDGIEVIRYGFVGLKDFFCVYITCFLNMILCVRFLCACAVDVCAGGLR